MRKQRRVKVGIAGCGAIGSTLAKIIQAESGREMMLAGIYDVDASRAEALARRMRRPRAVVPGLNELIMRSDLIIEATRLAAALPLVIQTLSLSRHILVMSVGGILKEYARVQALARKKGVNVFIPSGAICGLDGVKAALCGRIKSAVLTTTKPVKAFEGVAYVIKNRISLNAITSEKLIFSGNVLEAIDAFPQNINVAATLALAGIGPRKTRVRIIASKKASRNVHEIEIESESGRVWTRTENVIHPENPKTSYLAVLSAVAALKQIVGAVKVGT